MEKAVSQINDAQYAQARICRSERSAMRAEAIEAVFVGRPRATAFQRVMAAAAYHLAHYSARAYCLLPWTRDDVNLSLADAMRSSAT